MTKASLKYPCPLVLDEFRRVLGRKLSATRAEVEEAVAIIGEAVHATAEPTEKVEGVCRDPDDDNVLACAQAAETEYLVTGDSDLLELKKFREITILTPRHFELLFAH